MFYNIYLSKNGSRLFWRMGKGLRAALGFTLISVLAMLVWVVTSGVIIEASLFGRLNLVLVPAFLLVAVFYEDSVVLDRDEGWLETRVGLLFLKRIKRWPAGELTGIEYRVVRGGRKKPSNVFSGNLRTRVFFGFQMRDQLIILDRSCRPGKAEIWLRAIRAFWPEAVDIAE